MTNVISDDDYLDQYISPEEADSIRRQELIDARHVERDTCTTEGCNRHVFVRGKCKRCYRYWQYHSNPEFREKVKAYGKRWYEKSKIRAKEIETEARSVSVSLSDLTHDELAAFAWVVTYRYVELINATEPYHKLASMGLFVFRMKWLEKPPGSGLGEEVPVYVPTPMADKVVGKCIGMGRNAGKWMKRDNP